MGGNSGQSPAPTGALFSGLLFPLSAMSNNAVVSVIDDDSAARQSLVFLLSAAGIAVRTSSPPQASSKRLQPFTWVHHHRHAHAGHERSGTATTVERDEVCHAG